MPIGKVTKRWNNEKNIRVTFDDDKDKSYTTNKSALYPLLEQGNTVDYKIQQNGQYWNIVEATPVEASAAPATPGPAVGRSTLTEKDTLIVDQVLFKGAIDLQVSQPGVPAYMDPKEAASDAVLTWNWVLYYRHGGNSPLVEAGIEEGGQITSVEERKDSPAEQDDV